LGQRQFFSRYRPNENYPQVNFERKQIQPSKNLRKINYLTPSLTIGNNRHFCKHVLPTLPNLSVFQLYLYKYGPDSFVASSLFSSNKSRIISR